LPTGRPTSNPEAAAPTAQASFRNTGPGDRGRQWGLGGRQWRLGDLISVPRRRHRRLSRRSRRKAPATTEAIQTAESPPYSRGRRTTQNTSAAMMKSAHTGLTCCNPSRSLKTLAVRSARRVTFPRAGAGDAPSGWLLRWPPSTST
jgi:hypothetical protein